jgi:hypothetical protein
MEFTLTCQNEFLVNNRLDVKEDDESALDFAFYLSRYFSVLMSKNFLFKAFGFFSESLSIHCQDLRPLFPRFAQNLYYSFVGSTGK